MVKTLSQAQIEAKEGDDFGPWDDVTCLVVTRNFLERETNEAANLASR